MSLNMHRYSHIGLVLCLSLIMTSSGCATWNKFVGKKDEPSPKLSLAWAKLKESEGNLTEARHGYEQVLAKDPQNADAVLGMARMNLKAKRLVEAEQGLEQAMTMKPDSTEVLTEVGNFYADQQRWDKAIPVLEKAQRLEPHEKNLQFNLAVALAKAGRRDEAIPYFREAVGEAEAYYNVGRILLETGKRADAEEQFVVALSKNPNLTDAQFFLDEIRAGSSGRAQQLPVVDRTSRGHVAQQVAGTAYAEAEEPNPFEETPVAGYSNGDGAGTNLTQNRSSRSRPTQSGRQPLYPHRGFEELAPPAE